MERVDLFTCELALRRLDDYLDRELTIEEMERVSAHLEFCAHCAGMFAAEADLLQGIRNRLQRIAVPPNLSARLLNALR